MGYSAVRKLTTGTDLDANPDPKGFTFNIITVWEPTWILSWMEGTRSLKKSKIKPVSVVNTELEEF